MMASILSFPIPADSRPTPAQVQPDDRERVMDRGLFYDEPEVRALIASLDDESRRILEAAAVRERARMPIFPAHFVAQDLEAEYDTGECIVPSPLHGRTCRCLSSDLVPCELGCTKDLSVGCGS
jgi:hypothetical protein